MTNSLRVKLDGSDLKLLLEEKGWYSANFSPNYSKAVITYNNSQLPDQVYILFKYIHYNISILCYIYYIIYYIFILFIL
jgi:hypothetical protein